MTSPRPDVRSASIMPGESRVDERRVAGRFGSIDSGPHEPGIGREPRPDENRVVKATNAAWSPFSSPSSTARCLTAGSQASRRRCVAEVEGEDNVERQRSARLGKFESFAERPFVQ